MLGRPSPPATAQRLSADGYPARLCPGVFPTDDAEVRIRQAMGAIETAIASLMTGDVAMALDDLLAARMFLAAAHAAPRGTLTSRLRSETPRR